MSKHVHVFVHVASKDWRGRPVIVSRCVCGESRTPAEILAERAAAGL